MKRFTYQARDRQGKKIKGIVEAVEEKRAIAAIRERGLIVISLTEVTPNIFSSLF